MKQFLNLFRFVLHICDTEVMAGDQGLGFVST